MKDSIFDKAAKAVEDTLRWTREEPKSMPSAFAKGVTQGVIQGSIVAGIICAAQGLYDCIITYSKK